MRQFRLLFLNTIQKEYRSKTLIFAFIFTSLLIFISYSLLDYFMETYLRSAKMQGFDAPRTAFIVMSYVISYAAFLLSITFGVNSLKSDMEDNVAPLLMAFPVSRLEYLLARLMGCWAIVTIYYVMSLLVVSILFSLTSDEFVAGINLIASMFFTSLSNLVVLVIACFLGLHLPKISGFISTTFLCLLVAGSNQYFIEKDWYEVSQGLGMGKAIGWGVYQAFPRIGTLDEIGRRILTEEFVYLSIPLELLHFVLTLSIVFGLFYLVFRRREI